MSNRNCNNNNAYNNKRSLDSKKVMGIKKNKIDENNDKSGSGSSTEIDTNLEKKTIEQLKEIASSIGITVKSPTKKQYIERITNVNKLKQELLEKQKIYDNINSFNKGVVEFTIKEGVDTSELLFWKVFRDKIIYKKIMSNMDTHLSPTYGSITSVLQMINSGQISMLRDKIIRNQYLTFKCDGYEIMNQISNVFKRDDESDTLLYTRFFKYYSKYIFHFNNVKIIKGGGKTSEITDGVENKTILINQLIVNGCLVALKVLVQHYKFQIHNDNFIKAVSVGSLKFVKFILLQPNFKPTIYYADIFNITDKIKSFKVLNFLQNKNISDLDKSTLSKYLLLCSKEIDGMSISVKQLIIICKTCSTIPKCENELISNTFKTIAELKSSLTDKSNQTNEKKQLITKLLDLVYLIDGFDKSEFYKLYFTNSKYSEVGNGDLAKLNEHVTPMETKMVLNYKLAYQFGNKSILQYCQKNSTNKILDELSRPSIEHQDFLFTHCAEKKQKSFLEYVVSGNGDNSFKPREYIKNIGISFAFLIIINHNNLELLKYFIGLLGGEHKKLVDTYGVSKYFKCIKSIEMLDFFWYHCEDLFQLDIYQFKNVDLLIRYEELYFEKNVTLLQFNKNSQYKPNISILHRVLACPTKYQLNIKSTGMIINQCNCGTYEKFEMFKMLFVNYQLKNKEYESCCLHKLESIAFSKYLNWLFINYPDNLKVPEYATIKKYNDIVYCYYHKSDEIPIIHDDKYPLFPFKHGENIAILDYILKKYIDLDKKKFNENVLQYFFNLLLQAFKENWLKSFEHILLHHEWVLKVAQKQSNSVLDGVFKLEELKKLIFTSISKSNLILAEYLLTIWPILTKIEFDSNASDLSISYFISNGFYNKLK